MSDLTDNLEKIILRAGIDGALTEDAVAQFHALVTERNAIKTELASLKEAHENLITNRDALNQKCQAAETCAQEWAGREQDLMDREGKCDHLEMEAKYQGLRVQDHKDMVSLVFRNTVLKKQMVTPGSATIDQYGTRNSEFPDTTPVEEEKT